MLLNIYICVRDAEAGGSNPLTPTTSNIASACQARDPQQATLGDLPSDARGASGCWRHTRHMGLFDGC